MSRNTKSYSFQNELYVESQPPLKYREIINKDRNKSTHYIELISFIDGLNKITPEPHINTNKSVRYFNYEKQLIYLLEVLSDQKSDQKDPYLFIFSTLRWKYGIRPRTYFFSRKQKSEQEEDNLHTWYEFKLNQTPLYLFNPRYNPFGENNLINGTLLCNDLEELKKLYNPEYYEIIEGR